MKWLIALLISGFLTLALLDAGLFEHERFGIATVIGHLPFLNLSLIVIGSPDAKHASPTARLAVSTIVLIIGLYAAVRLLLNALPQHWFTLDNGNVGRLPDPRLLKDRVRDQEDNPRLKKLVHVTNSGWMSLLATMTMFFLLVSLPVVILNRVYAWPWGLSFLVPLALYGCAIKPDRPRKLSMADDELKQHLTPESLGDDREPPRGFRAGVRKLIRRTRSPRSSPHGPRGASEPTRGVSSSRGARPARHQRRSMADRNPSAPVGSHWWSRIPLRRHPAEAPPPEHDDD